MIRAETDRHQPLFTIRAGHSFRWEYPLVRCREISTCCLLGNDMQGQEKRAILPLDSRFSVSLAGGMVLTSASRNLQPRHVTKRHESGRGPVARRWRAIVIGRELLEKVASRGCTSQP